MKNQYKNIDNHSILISIGHKTLTAVYRPLRRVKPITEYPHFPHPCLPVCAIFDPWLCHCGTLIK